MLRDCRWLPSPGADGKNYLNLLPRIFFFSLSTWFCHCSHFFLYILKTKKSNLFNISTAEADLETICIMLTYYATGPKPSPAYARTQKHTCTAPQHNQGSLLFFKTIFFPSISSVFSSQATFSLCCEWESEQHCPAVHCRAKPWGGSLQKLTPF